MSLMTTTIGREHQTTRSSLTLSTGSLQGTSNDETASPSAEQFIFACSLRRSAAKPSPFAQVTLLICGLAAAICVVAWVAYRGSVAQAALQATQIRTDNYYGAVTPVDRCLASQFVDGDRDMLADGPSDPAQFIDPDTLVVAHYEGDYDDEPRVNWPAFQAHLRKATGKRVILQEYLHTESEVAAIAAGQIHVVVPHSADVPCLVNSCGLVPFAALGTEHGPNGNHMVIAVRSNSTIKSFADLQGATLTCTRPLSITGYRAAVTILDQEADMHLDSDYKVYLTDGQARSIRGLAAGWFEVVAVSHDKLQWALDKGIIDPSDYRSIYESEIIPRRAVGVIHNLAPALAAKINAATLSFDNVRLSGEGCHTLPMRFYAIDYERDFQFVREMDRSFIPRCGKLLVASFGQ